MTTTHLQAGGGSIMMMLNASQRALAWQQGGLKELWEKAVDRVHQLIECISCDAKSVLQVISILCRVWQ